MELIALEPWHWLVLGLGLLIGELLTGSTYLLWIALAAWLTGLLFLLVPLAFPAQLLVFSASSLALTYVGRDKLKGRFWFGPAAARLNDPEHDLIGKVAVAQTAFAHGEGRVRLGDTEWRATCAEPVAAGQSVEVVDVDAATLRVAPQRRPQGQIEAT